MDAAATRWPAAGRGEFTRSSEPAPVKHRSSGDNDKSKLPFATATLAGNTLASTDAELQGSSFSQKPMISLTMEQVWIIRLQVRRDQVAGDRLLQLIRTHFETSGEEKKENKKKTYTGKTRSGCIEL